MGSISTKVRFIIILTVVGINLTACNKIEQSDNTSNQSDMHLYQNDEKHYKFAVPIGFAHTTDDEEGMYFGYGENSNFGTVAVQSYDKINSIKCTPALTGSSQSVNLPTANGDTVWGKVDYWDKEPYDSNSEPLCYLPSMPTQELTERFAQTRAAYGLCSEKNGAIIILCISQMTDNPKMAEEIFKTFRWLE